MPNQQTREGRRLSSGLLSVRGVCFLPDGRAASAGVDRKIHLWEIQTGKELRQCVGHNDWISSVACSPDGQRIASASDDGTLRLWDVQGGNEILRCVGHKEEVTCVEFFSNGRFILSAGGGDGTLRRWDAGTGQLLWTSDDAGWVGSVAVSADGRFAASDGFVVAVRVWELAEQREIQRVSHKNVIVHCVAISPDGNLCVAGFQDRVVRAWNVKTGKCVRSVAEHKARVTSVAVSPDGRAVLSASEEGSLLFWEVESGRVLSTLNGHTAKVNCVAFSQDGHLAASGSDDGTVRLWHLPTIERGAIAEPPAASSSGHGPSNASDILGIRNRITSQEPVFETPLVSPFRATCPACGHPSSGNAYCTNCGAKLAAEPPMMIMDRPSHDRRCPRPDCGQPIAPGKQFCTCCGTRLS